MYSGIVTAVIFQGEHYYRTSKGRVEKTLTKRDFVGYYERTPVRNLYHVVDILLDDDQLIWKNPCTSWDLSFDGVRLRKVDDKHYEAQVLQIFPVEVSRSNIPRNSKLKASME